MAGAVWEMHTRSMYVMMAKVTEKSTTQYRVLVGCIVMVARCIMTYTYLAIVKQKSTAVWAQNTASAQKGNQIPMVGKRLDSSDEVGRRQQN
jgi:hypothetical protein